MSVTPDVVVVGSACRDLVEDDPRGWRLGGGASYSALAFARLGLGWVPSWSRTTSRPARPRSR